MTENSALKNDSGSVSRGLRSTNQLKKQDAESGTLLAIVVCMNEFTQTAEQATAKLIRFPSKAACEAYIAFHGLLAMPHNAGASYIAICYLTAGVFGVSSPTTCELLPEW